jgi:hypothetical protein
MAKVERIAASVVLAIVMNVVDAGGWIAGFVTGMAAIVAGFAAIERWIG